MRYLSYPIADTIPVYGRVASPALNRVKSIARGDTANVYRFSMENHWGTHVDAPAHFFDGAKGVADYPADFWFFNRPAVVRVNLAASEILNCGRWMDNMDVKADILLFQSGWGELRSREVYSRQNPGIHPDVGFMLRETFTSLRAIGIDWVSVSAFGNRTFGARAHRAFLDPEGMNNPILIIEDMDLSGDLTSLRRLMVAPLRIDKIDSAQCTVVGMEA